MGNHLFIWIKVMDRRLMTKIAQVFLAIALLHAPQAWVENNDKEPVKEAPKKIEAKMDMPYERPIGFTINLGAVLPMTFEGRFLLGLAQNLSLVVAPMYQNTIELPFFHPKRGQLSFFDIKRFNIGAGLRGHFYEYDSWDGWFIEALGRGGMTWVGSDQFQWSVIPSLMFGYAAVYDSGYTVSCGLGFEWEFLIGKNPGYYTEYLKTAYYGITKLPLTGELAIGWTW